MITTQETMPLEEVQSKLREWEAWERECGQTHSIDALRSVSIGKAELLSSALQHLETLKRDKARIDGLRELCGYIEAGEGETISIGQDDATRSWVIHRGKEWWHGESFRGVIDSAMSQPVTEGKE